jgi:hypothetical protein
VYRNKFVENKYNALLLQRVMIFGVIKLKDFNERCRKNSAYGRSHARPTCQVAQAPGDRQPTQLKR